MTNYHYDEQQRLDTLSTDVGGSSIADDISESFSYNLAGQIKNRAMTATNTGYFYTPSISAANNYVPNSLNQIASQNGVTFEYDGRGNLTKDNAGRTYTYSASNLLLNSTLAGATTSLSYDAENRLFNAVNSSTNTKFTYDGTNLIAETDSNNAILRRYVPGPGTDEPLAKYEGSDTTNRSYYTTDRQGSVVGITSQSGAQSATNAYDEYGIQKVLGIGRFQYTGQIWIASLGLYYYKARFYSPTLGRFLQTDPIGYKDGMNWYAYTNNDPVTNIDPTGEASKVASLVRLTADGVRIVARISYEQAVRLRRMGENVHADRRQLVGTIEKAANGGSKKTGDLMEHAGHELTDEAGNKTGKYGIDHFQTEGKNGHTFYGAISSGLVMVTIGLNVVADKVAVVADVVDPTTYLMSGDSYEDGKGNLISSDELLKQRKEESEQSKCAQGQSLHCK